MKAKKSSSSEPSAFLPALDSQLSSHMLIFHWQLPFKCQFTSRCWEAAFVSLIKSQRGKVWGLTVLWGGWDRAAAAAESGRPWPTRMARVKCTGKGLCTWGHQQPQLRGCGSQRKPVLGTVWWQLWSCWQFPAFLGWLAAARTEAKHWVIEGDRFKCSSTEKIYSTEEQGEGWRRKPSLPDICTYLKSFPIKFIMNLIQSPMAQRNFLSNKNVLLRDRWLPNSYSLPAMNIYTIGT